MRDAVTAQPLPVYLQIAELLARQIKAGYWREGERLPTEAALAVQLDVAVGTLRKALALLAEQGTLERIQGSGTYVKKAAGASRIYELFRLELHDGPGLPTARILGVRKVNRPPEVPAELTSQGTLWRVRRLRLLSQQPVSLEEIWFDGANCEALTPKELGDSMYLFYQQRFGVWIARVEDRIGVGPVPAWAVADYGQSAGDCAGFIERFSWTASNSLAEYSRTWFHPGVARYSSRMSQ